MIYNPYNLSQDNSTYAGIGSINGAGGALNLSVYKTNESSVSFNGGGIQFANSTTLDDMVNFTMYVWVNYTNNGNLMIMGKQDTGITSGNAGTFTIHHRTAVSGSECMIENIADGGPGFGSTNDGLWHFLTCVINQTGAAEMTVTTYLDGARIGSDVLASLIDRTTIDVTISGIQGGGAGQGFVGFIDEGGIINRSLTDIEIKHLYNFTYNGSKVQRSATVIPDTTPPEITLINLTSEGGLGQIIDLNNRLAGTNRTNDTTPTFFVKTDESATCCIIDNNADLNWTDCYAGTANLDSGAPATTHTLTLNESNATGRAGLHNFSIGCKDSTGNENSTSTSGKLTINITDNVPPNVTLFKPDNRSVYQIGINFTLDSTIIQVNWSATDNYDTSITNCSLFFNDTLKHNVTNYINNTLISSNVTHNTFGIVGFFVNCTDTYNNKNQSQLFVLTINEQIFDVNIDIQLNGTNASKSYEYNTLLLDKDYGVNITIITLPENNWSLDFDYMINWSKGRGNTTILINITELNNTKFLNGNFSINITAGINNVTISQDNNTDLVRIGFKVRGYNVDGYPQDVNFDINNDNKTDIAIRGLVLYDYAQINQFISGSTNYTNLNLSYSTAGSRTISINVSTDLDIKNFTMLINGFDVDADNVFSYTEHFNGTAGSKGFNGTLTYQADAPLGYFDDFEVNRTDIWSLTQSGNSCDSGIAYSTGNNNDRLSLSTSHSTACTAIDCTEILDYTDLFADIRNTSRVELIFITSTSSSTGSNGASGGGSIEIRMTDGTSNVILYSTADDLYRNLTLIKKSNDYKNWEVFINGSSQGNKDISSLDFTKQIKLQWQISSTASGPCSGSAGSGSASLNLYDLKWGGAILNRSTNNGTYKSNGNITACINVSAKNISRATLSWTPYEPTNTKILGYLTNTCNSSNPTFESVTNDISLIFSSVGNSLGYRFNLNSSVNTTSPVVRKATIDVISASVTNVSVDFGSDGDTDWNYPDKLNSTTSPKFVNGTIGDFSTYITDNCPNVPTCNVPVSISTKSGGIVEINVLNLTQNLDEITISNLTFLETKTIWNWTIKLLRGALDLYDLDIEFKGSKNITLFAKSVVNSTRNLGTANLTLQVYYSKFNATFPKGINEMQLIYPEFFNLNQSNISIYGQTIRYCNSSVDVKCAHFSTPIFNITSYAYDLPIDVYLYANNTINNTINHSFDLGVNRTTTIQIFNESETKIIINLSRNSSKSIFGFVDIKNMTWEKLNSTNFNYDFLWKTFCNSCVR